MTQQSDVSQPLLWTTLELGNGRMGGVATVAHSLVTHGSGVRDTHFPRLLTVISTWEIACPLLGCGIVWGGGPLPLKYMPLSPVGTCLDAILHLLKLWPKDSDPSLAGTCLQHPFRTQKAAFEIQLCVILVGSNFLNSNFIDRELLKTKSVSQLMSLQSCPGIDHLVVFLINHFRRLFPSQNLTGWWLNRKP